MVLIMNKRRLVIILITLCFVAVLFLKPTSVFANTDNKISNEAQEHILNELQKARIPNAAIAIIKDGEVSYILKDSSKDSLFQIASVAKNFTAFGILLLEDNGLLSVDDPVSKFLPWFEVNYQGKPVPPEDITIGNLIHHTSGFTSHEGHFASVSDLKTTDELIRQIIGSELKFYPSEQFVYGNINYVLLGFIIEAVSGQSYDEYMTQNILNPLGLYNTFTNPERAHGTGLTAGGNRLGFLRSLPREVAYNDFLVPTGFIYSSIEDMGRWAGIHLGLIDVDEQFSRVVKRSHMFKSIRMPLDDVDWHYAGGWIVESNNDSIFHTGMTTGYTAVVDMKPKRNTAVVVLNNQSHAPVDDIPVFVLETIEDGSFKELQTCMYVILDIVYTVLSILGFIATGVFILFVFRLVKTLRYGYTIKCKFTVKNILLLLMPLLLLTITIGWNVLLCVSFGNTFSLVVLYSPASYIYANISMIVMAVYVFCFWLTKVFVQKPSLPT